MKKWSEMSEREQDALVAEKVMGWTHVQWRPMDDRRFKYMSGMYQGRLREVPQYHEDISAAWEVVQKMKETHWFELRAGILAESARFGDHFSKQEVIAQCETAPEAICIAALRAVGVDIE